MYLNVFVEVGPLSEAEAAVVVGADVGALVGVDSEVVKKVVPLPEPLVAPLVVTLQHLDVPLTPRVLVSEDTELLRVWHMLFDLHASQVKGAASLNSDDDVPTNLLESLTHPSEGVSSHLLLSRVDFRAGIRCS